MGLLISDGLPSETLLKYSDTDQLWENCIFFQEKQQFERDFFHTPHFPLYLSVDKFFTFLTLNNFYVLGNSCFPIYCHIVTI